MTLFERIKNLAARQGKSLNKVEEELGLSKNSLYSLKRNKPSADKLEAIADYFHVTVDYLLGRDEDGILTETDWLEMLKSQENFSGKPTSEADKEILKNVVLNYLKGQMKDED